MRPNLSPVSTNKLTPTYLASSFLNPSRPPLFVSLRSERRQVGLAMAVQRVIRRIHTTMDAPRLTRFSLQAPKTVEVEFANGTVFSLSAEFLRIYSPAVDGKIRSVGGEKVIFGRRHVGIMSAEPVGNYGVRIIFDDLHRTGIYTWDYFHHLGNNKFTLMRNYIETLRKHGLSRDPPKRKPGVEAEHNVVSKT